MDTVGTLLHPSDGIPPLPHVISFRALGLCRPRPHWVLWTLSGLGPLFERRQGNDGSGLHHSADPLRGVNPSSRCLVFKAHLCVLDKEGDRHLGKEVQGMSLHWYMKAPCQLVRWAIASVSALASHITAEEGRRSPELSI